MYTYVAKNLIAIAMYKSVFKSLRLSQRDINACIAPPSVTNLLLNTFTSRCNIHLFRLFSGKSNLY